MASGTGRILGTATINEANLLSEIRLALDIQRTSLQEYNRYSIIIPANATTTLPTGFVKVTDGIKFLVAIARRADTLIPRFIGWRLTDDLAANHTIYSTFLSIDVAENSATRYYTTFAGITRNDGVETLVEYIIGG